MTGATTLLFDHVATPEDAADPAARGGAVRQSSA